MELSDERTYATWLLWGTRIGLVALVVSFLLYAAGALPSYVAPSDLPRLWTLPVKRYLELTGAPAGWNWLTLWHKADFLCTVFVTLLSLVTPLCYVQLTASLAARRWTLFAWMALLQVAIFALAALVPVI